MTGLKKILLVTIVLAASATVCVCNIHRAVQSRSNRKVREDGLFTKYFTKTKAAWIFSIPAALLVGLTGILPLLIIPVEAGQSLREGVSPKNLKVLLSFAVGGLLGDVFLHLLPEAWMYTKGGHLDHWGHMTIGLWVIIGLLTFLILEKVFGENSEEDPNSEALIDNNVKESSHNENMKSSLNGIVPSSGDCDSSLSVKDFAGNKNGFCVVNGKNGINNAIHRNGLNKEFGECNGFCKIGDNMDIKKRHCEKSSSESTEDNENGSQDTSKGEQSSESIKVVGYLNLMANCIDNFTHGLAVAGSFIAGPKVGLCTTIAILLHEIPHEVGDFAILLKSGFNRWDAAKGQMITATGGVLGAVFGLMSEEAGNSSAWVLPFTSGGFIYIAMVTVVPDLLKETNVRESFKQTVSLLAGIGTMALVTAFHH